MKNLIVVIILVLLSACSEQKDNTVPNKEYFYYYKNDLKNHLAEDMNLPILEYSHDSTEIRIWMQIEISKQGHLMVIKKTNRGWNGFIYTYWRKGNQDLHRMSICDTFTVCKVNPKSGWRIFIKELNQQQFFELPEQHEVDKWKDKDISDGTSYAVEFIKNGKYRLYHYHCPDAYLEYWNSQQMNKIINLIMDEFSFDESQLGILPQLKLCRHYRNVDKMMFKDSVNFEEPNYIIP